MEIIVNTDKKEYFKCSMYYMRRYFGLREIILLSILLIIGVALFVFAGQMFMLILFAVSVFIILLALTLFLITSVTGYKVDMEKKGIAKQKLEFKEDALLVTNMDKSGTPIFIETHYYDKLDKISIKKRRIYIYAQVSVFYYISADKIDAETREALVDFLQSHVREDAFRIKKTHRALPKRKKLTLEENSDE